MTTATKPLQWIKKIQAALLELEERPQFHKAPPFPLHQLEASLHEILKVKVLLTTQNKGWTEASDLLKGLGKPLEALSIVFQPLESPIYWVMPKADVEAWIATLFAGSSESLPPIEESLGVGFFSYLAATVLQAVESTRFATPLVPRLTEMEDSIDSILQDTPCYVVDVMLEHEGRQSRGRLLMPADFRDSWKLYFGSQPKKPLSSEQLQSVPVELGLEAGHVRLPLSTWKQAKEGDLLVLDEWTYDPTTKKGRLLLTLNDRILFRGKIIGDGVKILEYPLYEKEGDPVDSRDDFEDEDSFFEDLSDEPSEEKAEDDENLALNLDDEEELAEETEEEGETEEPLRATSSGEKPSINVDEIKLHVRVEVASIKMTAKELMDLTPGDLIALDVAPEQGVDLIVQGKKIGRGELLKVGERLGVRILEK